MEIPPEGRHHEPERERLRLLQSHRGRRVVKAAQGRDLETKKEEEEKRETETQERELTNSFCPARRHFSILPYPETGFVSGNFCRVFENSQPNPKDCEVPLQRRNKEKKRKTKKATRVSWKDAGPALRDVKNRQGKNSLLTERLLSTSPIFFCASSRRFVLSAPRHNHPQAT